MKSALLSILVLGVVAYAVRRVVLMPWDKSQPLTLAEQRKQSLRSDGPRYRQTQERDADKLAIPTKVQQRGRLYQVKRKAS